MRGTRTVAAACLAAAPWIPLVAVAGEPPRPPLEGAPGGQDSELARILEKAGDYVVEYEQRFSGLVAEEEYEHWLDAGISQSQYQPGDFTSRLRAVEGRSQRAHISRRTTRADLVFVSLGPPFLWGTFRDVFAVDGEPVRERDGRLERLLAEAGTSAAARARRIEEESEAYSIGPLVRTINVPVLPLVFLHPKNQARLAFERKGRRRIAGVQGVEVRFEETARPTLVRGGREADLPAKGSFWIDPESGAVLRSRVEFTSSQSKARLETEYRSEPGLALWVPSEMEERYEGSGARARYSGFRRIGGPVEEGAPRSETPGPE